MPVSLSIGDIIAVGSLIADIVASLKHAGGAKSDYQELIRELESLDRALKLVDRLQGVGADGIKCAALMCRYPLEDFMSKIRKYEKSIGINGDAGVVKGASRNLQWTLGKKEEVAKLKSYLNVHMGSINMQLLATGLETLEASSKATEIAQIEVNRALEDSRSMISSLGSRMRDQVLLVQWTRTTVDKLYNMVNRDVITRLKYIFQAIARI
jgi:hypothetical protein